MDKSLINKHTKFGAKKFSGITDLSHFRWWVIFLATPIPTTYAQCIINIDRVFLKVAEERKLKQIKLYLKIFYKQM